MNGIRSESGFRLRRWGVVLLILAVVAFAVVALAVDRWLGKRALKNWKREMTAKGEVFEPGALWPPVSESTIQFSNRFAEATGKPLGRLGDYAGQIMSMVPEETGICRRGSQEAEPRMSYKQVAGSWRELDELLEQRSPMLQSLHELMKEPPAGGGFNAAKYLEGGPPPYNVGIRIAAQTVQASVINNLHKNDLPAVLKDLVCLLSFPKLHRNDPHLVNYMVRSAILRLCVDVCWDALQAEGWTEPQLAELQQACIDSGTMLAEMPRALEAERAIRIHDLQWFRTHTYAEWIARHKDVFASFGYKLPASDVSASVLIERQYVFHPIWSFAWAEQEELEFLRNHQLDIDALRGAVQTRSLRKLNERLDANHLAYHTPVTAWRLYRRLPLVDSFFEMPGGVEVAMPSYPYPDFSRAWWTMGTLTKLELVRTAIALRRHELRYGNVPSDLVSLTPEFLNASPCDFMDGQPLRYRRETDSSFTLYSVGQDMRDDGGNPVPNSRGSAFAWSGKDWVWPKVGVGSQIAKGPAAN